MADLAKQPERSEAVALAFFRFALGFLVLSSLIAYAVSPAGRKMQDDLVRVVERDEASGAGFVDKLRNDYGIRPTRFLTQNPPAADERFAPVAFDFSPKRTAQPLVFSRDQDRKDYFFILGAFEFDDTLLGALLVDRKGRVIHKWNVRVRYDDFSLLRKDYRVFPHGVALDSDGSALIAFDAGDLMLKIDACGREIWRKTGFYNHVMQQDPDAPGAAWAINNLTLEKIDIRTGAVLSAISPQALLEANPDTDIFGLRQVDGFESSTFVGDAFHFNDVDPLPARLADAYPMFSPGDLLVSARSLNLIFVVDPKTAKLKWHAFGYWRRQHDPDWGADGRIYVFNNNMHRNTSSTVAIDPATNKTETVVDGSRYDFYTAIRGKQQAIEGGRRLITSPQQGRAFEIDENGDISFEFINAYDKDTGEALVISEAIKIGPDDISIDALKACPAD